MILVYLYPTFSEKEMSEVYEFTNNKNNNGLNLLIVSGTHGNECMSQKTTCAVMSSP